MKNFLQTLLIIFLFIFVTIKINYAQSTLDCSICHGTVHSSWVTSHHANTQIDVAGELAGEWIGLPPDSVINGQNAEDCIACHGPISITANGGMTEVQALSYFFSTTSGLFTASTDTLNSSEWPSNDCVTCHDVQSGHPSTSMPTLAIYNSPTAQYIPVANSSILCGQCHGTLRYADTDHRRMDAWQLSKHGHGGQADVAGELGAEWVGNTPAEVISQEDCIACHAATSVLLNGGISESDALNQFFTTTGGVFSASTTTQDTSSWPQVSCTTCHNQHNPDTISYFNSGTSQYEVLSSSQELCGQCHGNLRFPNTDHLSYNIAEGTGGIGVSDLQTMPGIKCVDCHMHADAIDGSNSAMYGGHLWNAFINETSGVSASCTSCHPTMTATAAQDTVNAWKAEYAYLDSIANVDIAIAADSLIGSSDSTAIHMMQDIQANLAFAEGDESGGVHNHNYTISLLNNVVTVSGYIISGIDLASSTNGFLLLQNYPNPFNRSTNIEYRLPKATTVTIEIFNLKGEKIKTLFTSKYETAGTHFVTFNAVDLPSGIYYCNMKTGKFSKAMRMTILH